MDAAGIASARGLKRMDFSAPFVRRSYGFRLRASPASILFGIFMLIVTATSHVDAQTPVSVSPPNGVSFTSVSVGVNSLDYTYRLLSSFFSLCEFEGLGTTSVTGVRWDPPTVTCAAPAAGIPGRSYRVRLYLWPSAPPSSYSSATFLYNNLAVAAISPVSGSYKTTVSVTVSDVTLFNTTSAVCLFGTIIGRVLSVVMGSGAAVGFVNCEAPALSPTDTLCSVGVAIRQGATPVWGSNNVFRCHSMSFLAVQPTVGVPGTSVVVTLANNVPLAASSSVLCRFGNLTPVAAVVDANSAATIRCSIPAAAAPGSYALTVSVDGGAYYVPNSGAPKFVVQSRSLTMTPSKRSQEVTTTSTVTFSVSLNDTIPAGCNFTVSSNNTAIGVPNVASITVPAGSTSGLSLVVVMTGAIGTCTIRITKASNCAVSIADVVVVSATMRRPNITLGQTSLALQAGQAGSIAVSLSSEPIDDTRLSVQVSGPSGVVTVQTLSLLFTSQNYYVAQQVVLSGVATGNVSIVLFKSSGTSTVTNSSVSIAISGTPAIVVQPSSVLVHAGYSGSFSVSLSRAPIDNTLVSIVVGDTRIGSLNRTTVIFTPTNFSSPVTVSVTGLLAGSCSIQLQKVTGSSSLSASTVAFSALVVPTLILSDATASIFTGATRVITAKLSSDILANVTVALSLSSSSVLSLSASNLTFMAANAKIDQTVTVRGLVAGVSNLTLSASVSSALRVPSALCAVTVVGTTSVVLSPASLETEVGRVTTFNVSLSGRCATGEIRLAVVSSIATGIAVSTSLIVIPANSTAPVAFNVTALAPVTGTVSVSATSGACSVTSAAATIVIRVVPTLIVAGVPSSLYVGRAGSFSIALSSVPMGAVSITVVPVTSGSLSVQPSSFVFGTANYSTPVMVSISGVTTIPLATLSVYRVSGESKVANASFSTSVLGIPSLVVSPTTALLETDSSRTFAVSLSSAPIQSVSLSLAVAASTMGLAIPSVLTFSSSSFSIPQTVTYTTGSPGNSVVNIVDSSVSGAIVPSSRFNATVLAKPSIVVDWAGTAIEPGSSRTIGISLSCSSADLTLLSVTVASRNIATVTPTLLWFGPANSTVVQLLTVQGVTSGENVIMLTKTSGFSTIGSRSISVSVAVPPIVILSTASQTMNVNGGILVAVSLSRTPVDATTITGTAADGTLLVSPASLTFATSNCNVPQTVTVMGKAVGYGSVVFSKSSGRSPIASVSFAGTVIAAPALLVSQAEVTSTIGGKFALSISLSYAPLSSFLLGVMSTTGSASVYPSSLSFSATNYNIKQTVTVLSNSAGSAAIILATLPLSSAYVQGRINVTILGPVRIMAESTTFTMESGRNFPLSIWLTSSCPQNSLVTLTVLCDNEDGSRLRCVDNNNDGLCRDNDHRSWDHRFGRKRSRRDISVDHRDDDDDDDDCFRDYNPDDYTGYRSCSDGVVSTAPKFFVFSTTNGTTPQVALVLPRRVGTARIVLSSVAGCGDVPDVTIQVTVQNSVTLVVGSAATTLFATQSVPVAVTLSGPPLDTTVFSVAGSTNAGIVSLSPSTLTFTRANFASPQNVNALGLIAGTAVVSITLRSGMSVVPTAFFNSTVLAVPLFTLSPGFATTDVGGFVTFGLSLSSSPFGLVVASVASPTGVVTVSPTSFAFTASNFSSIRTVTVTGVTAGSRNVSVALLSGSAPIVPVAYLATVIPAASIDTATSLSVESGTPELLGVRLTSAPIGTTTIGLSVSSSLLLTVSPQWVTFTASNFSSWAYLSVGTSVLSATTATITLAKTSGLSTISARSVAVSLNPCTLR
eukprot:Opistho-2@43991